MYKKQGRKFFIHIFCLLLPLCLSGMKGQCSRKLNFSSGFSVCFSDPTQSVCELSTSCLMVIAHTFTSVREEIRILPSGNDATHSL